MGEGFCWMVMVEDGREGRAEQALAWGRVSKFCVPKDRLPRLLRWMSEDPISRRMFVRWRCLDVECVDVCFTGPHLAHAQGEPAKRIRTVGGGGTEG